MQLTALAIGAVLLGQVPDTAPLRPVIEQPPSAVQRTSEVEPPTDLPVVPLADPAVAAGEHAPQSAAPRQEGSGPSTPPDETAPVSVLPTQRRLTPPEMVAEALSMPPESRLAGRPLSLLSALSSTAQQQTRLEVIHAYWRLAEAVAVYGFSLEYDRWLQDLPAAAQQDEAALQAARASSSALVHEAQVAAVAAQHELAALVLLPPDALLPLPADRPHVGPYNTRFDQLFSTRTPPGRTRLIDRTLPLRVAAIERRAAAVQATGDALAAADGSDQTTLRDRLASAEEHLQQRQAFFLSVCRYNDEIAEYALAAIGPGSTPQALVAMLISTDPQPLRPIPLGADEGVEPAGYQHTVPTTAGRPGQRVPTPAPPETRPRDGDEQPPIPADSWSPSDPAGGREPTPAVRQPVTDPAESTPPQPPPTPVEPKPVEPKPVEPKPVVPTPVTVQRPAAGGWVGLCPSVFQPSMAPPSGPS